jgi:ribonuclease H2 subunit C
LRLKVIDFVLYPCHMAQSAFGFSGICRKLYASRLPRHEIESISEVRNHCISRTGYITAPIQLNMLAINSTKSDKKVTPNILPCAIKHNGPVSAAERYWNPSTEQDGTTTAFFRGRKLRGKKVVLPEGYEGVVLQKTDKKIVAKSSMPIPGAEDEAATPKEIETLAMDQHASFGEVTVWDHEAVPEGADVYVKGIEEWIGFAEAVSSGIHCFAQNHWLIVTI